MEKKFRMELNKLGKVLRMELKMLNSPLVKIFKKLVEKFKENKL